MTSVSPSPALVVRGLRKAYQDVVAVDGLDLEVYHRECFGLLGPNGAGKTTTIEICEGLNTADCEYWMSMFSTLGRLPTEPVMAT